MDNAETEAPCPGLAFFLFYSGRHFCASVVCVPRPVLPRGFDGSSQCAIFGRITIIAAGLINASEVRSFILLPSRQVRNHVGRANA